MRKYFYFFIIFLHTYAAVAQDDGKQYQPEAYNQEEINSEFAVYHKQARNLTDYLPQNYVRDATVDYTRYLQQGINENATIIMPNFPVLINDNGLKLKSNQVLLFDVASALRLVASGKETYNMLELHHVENVKIFSPRIEGDILTHRGTTGEWGMGIGIRSSKNIQVYNPQITNCWGDGIYVGYVKEGSKLYNECEDIGVYNGYLNNNGRNGISIVAVKGMNVYHNLIANTKRTFPKSGIDIEPGPKVTQDVVLMNNVTYKNGARGVDVFLRTIAKAKNNTTTAKIVYHKDIGSPIGIRIAGYKSDKKMNKVNGNVEIISPSLIDNRLKSIDIESDQRFAPNITIRDIKQQENFDRTLKGIKSNNQIKVL